MFACFSTKKQIILTTLPNGFAQMTADMICIVTCVELVWSVLRNFHPNTTQLPVSMHSHKAEKFYIHDCQQDIKNKQR
jgi:hypothetical protein